jgi:hypothetical protein
MQVCGSANHGDLGWILQRLFEGHTGFNIVCLGNPLPNLAFEFTDLYADSIGCEEAPCVSFANRTGANHQDSVVW